MQEIFIYIYNIVFMILYLWVINVSDYAYKSTSNRLFYYLALLYVILIIDSAIAFSFDLFKMTNVNLNVDNRACCLVRVLIYLLGGNCYVKLMSCMLDERPKLILYLPVIIAFLLDFILILHFYNPANTVVMQRSIQDGGILFLCLIYFSYVRSRPKQNSHQKYYNRAVALTGIFMTLSCLEGATFFLISNFHADNFAQLLNYMKVIGFNEDLFSIVISFLIIWFAKQEEQQANKNQLEVLVQQKMDQYQAMIHEKENSSEENQVVDFCQYYQMTRRESEILRLVLKGKKNQEIADELFISVGTVKSHIYSIYKKLAVDRRSQLMHVFMEYKEK